MKAAALLLAGAALAPAHAEVQFNQLGFLPGGAKWAVVGPGGKAARFSVVEDGSGRLFWRGRLAPAATWAPAGQAVQLAQFDGLTRPGRYRLRVPGQPDSAPFVIAADAYAALNAAALKAYYFNRASTPLLAEHAGPWARPAGHADDDVIVHASAATAARPAGSRIAAPKGWYDAGDYNKYIVNSGITTYTLLAAWEHFPAQFQHQALNIPESGNSLPDLLDEVLWNLDWMLAMQDPADGGVHHKLTSLRFNGNEMPHQDRSPRYVVQQTTAAALDFAAVMATASRVFQPFEAQRPGLSARLLQAARAAWQWARANPDVVYRQPDDVKTGQYGDDKLADEFAWAAAELFITTGEPAFRAALPLATLPVGVPGWADVGSLAWVSLAQHRGRLSAEDAALVSQRVRSVGTELAATWQASAYRSTMQARDFNWGSNSNALNQGLMLVQAYRLSGERAQLDAAQAALDYVLGRNPQGLSYVTGQGRRSPLHPHHRPSEADGVDAPVPGFIVGGPNPGRQDAKHCPLPYTSALPALAYLDHGCSYASNEVAINWNAPLVYLSAALPALTPPPAR